MVADPKRKPQQNCIIERFNKTARENLFNTNLFFTLDQAKELAEEFASEYNSEKPHESIRNKTPL